MDDENKKVVLRIKEIRIQKNILQTEIANALGLTSTAYNRIENNKTQLTINNLYTIAQKLEVEIDYLLNIPRRNSAYNTNNIVMSQFNNGTLHIAITAEDFKKMATKPFT